MEIEFLYVFLYLILAHWVADFVFQDEYWALNKKNSLKALLSHTITYSLMVSLMFLWILSPMNLLIFWAITFVTHTITDYFSSKIVGKKFENKEMGSPIPNLGAFSVIGLDQVIHYITLFFTLYLLL